MANKAQTSTPATPQKRAQLSQGDMPAVKLSEALRIPIAIRDNYGMQPATPVDVGVAVGIAPTSGSFRMLAGAAIAFGLTTGGYNAAEIALTDLGRRVVAPTEDGDDVVATREAFERPRVIKAFVAKYQGSKLPASTQVAKNVLHGLGVPLDRTDRTYELLVDGLKTYGYLRDVNGSLFVQRPQGTTAPAHSSPPSPDEADAAEEILDDLDDHRSGSESELPPVPPKRPNAIFLGHGKNRKPLDQLIKILDEYGIPHKEAMREPNAGRPIPTKVADTMRECGAAILIFTADEKFKDVDDNEIWRPSENVVHELGAASVLYDNRIIIFKEEDVSLASNFSGIGYISFDKDKLSDKGVDLFRELVSFKIVNISVGG
jgi:Predicted nucleotide-binding protein containing TIR-like domain